jgi:rod shape determining protein RodA
MATRVIQSRARAQAPGEVASFLRHLDYLLFAAVGGLVAYGLWVLSAVTRNDVAGDPSYYVFRQGINVGLGVVVLAALTAVNPEVYRRLRRPLYGLLILLLAIVCVAGILADRSRRLEEWRTLLSAVGLGALPAFLVFIEPDFGTALMYLGALAAAVFIAGVPWSRLAAFGVTASAAVITLLWVFPSAGIDILKPYQVQRLTGFLNPDLDPSGTTYNATQSITAVGSGGLDGRGIAGATQTNLNYLPEHATDFIFSSLAEQRGFLGASILLLLYALIVWRGIKIIAVAPSLFTAVVAASIVFVFVGQIFVNVGMTIGIAPVTGITLPFVSYGGSSMLVSLMMIGLLQAIHVRGRLAGRS